MLRDPNTHKAVLLRILRAVYTDITIGPNLGFKGGTAALLVYGLDRFSVDLDFDLLDASKEDVVFTKLQKLLSAFGTIKEQHKKYFTLFFLLSYADEAHNVKVEISRRQTDSHFVLQDYLGVSMLVMTREDMFANKLLALCERRKTANRDIYDVWFFLKNYWPINQSLVEKHSGVEFQEYLKKAIRFLEAYDDYILQGIGELLDAKQKAWVKAHLKEETLFLLKSYLSVM